MKKKFLYYFTLISCILLLCLSSYFNITYSSFSSENVKESITVLSSQTYSGRLPGSNENSLVSEAIRKSFEDSKLSPLNDSYKEDFTTTCPVKTNSAPYIKFYENGAVTKELTYGKDFKEDMLNFKINSITFSKENTVNIYTRSIDVTTPEGTCLFYVSDKDDFSFRSSFMSNCPYDMVIIINTNTYNAILDSIRNGLEVAVHIPFSTEEKSISNVVGVIEGKSENLPPLVLTAHYDHLGSDGLGNIYWGALDNASGTSFLLELQRSLSTYAKPKRDIIFVALNAEEFGLLGSKSFAENNLSKLKDAEVINFDMIGAKDFPITFMQGANFKDKDSELLKSIQEICTKNNIPFEVTYQDSSDHASFNNLGIDSLSFCHSDMSRIHTPNDKVDVIDLNAIESVYNVVEEKIFDSSYSKLSNFLYSKYSMITFGSLLGVLLIIGFVTRNRNNKI